MKKFCGKYASLKRRPSDANRSVPLGSVDKPLRTDQTTVLVCGPFSLHGEFASGRSYSITFPLILILIKLASELVVKTDESRWTLRSWTKGHALDVFHPQSLQSYRQQMSDPARVHAMCEDYRAGASIDRRLDLSDKSSGAKIAAPLLFIWSNHGFPAATGHPLGLWQAWTERLSGAEVDSGHFMPEENPDALLAAALPFLKA